MERNIINQKNMNKKQIIKEHYKIIGKKRWENIDTYSRSEHMAKIGEIGRKSRWSKTTPEQRSEFVRKVLLKGLEDRRRGFNTKKGKSSVQTGKDA